MSNHSDLEEAHWALSAYDLMALATISSQGPHVGGMFFAPRIVDGGLQLVTASQQSSQRHVDLRADPRVAFLCSPGNISRWAQGVGIAAVHPEASEREQWFRLLLAHAPSASQFIASVDVVPVTIAVTSLRVVASGGSPARTFALGSS